MENNLENNRIASLNIDLPYRGTGNNILHKMVIIDVFKDETDYTAVPRMTLEERRLASVPPELHFEYKDGRGQTAKGIREGNADLIYDIILQLKDQNILK